MTLFIASAKGDAQLIVADRRITDSRTGKVYDDSAYKIFLYENRRQGYRFGVAFTGLSHLDNVSTLDWLMATLPKVMNQDNDIGIAITAFTSECTNRFKAITTLPIRYKGITIVFCGRYNKFGPHVSLTEQVPFLTIISNCVDKIGRQINSVSNDFAAFSSRLLKPKSHITLCRGDLSSASRYPKEFMQVRRLFRRDLSHKTKIRIAIDYIRTVASRSHTVGLDVLGLALLKNGNAEGFDYHVDENNIVRTMPHFVSADGTILTNFKVTPA